MSGALDCTKARRTRWNPPSDGYHAPLLRPRSQINALNTQPTIRLWFRQRVTHGSLPPRPNLANHHPLPRSPRLRSLHPKSLPRIPLPPPPLPPRRALRRHIAREARGAGVGGAVDGYGVGDEERVDCEEGVEREEVGGEGGGERLERKGGCGGGEGRLGGEGGEDGLASRCTRCAG